MNPLHTLKRAHSLAALFALPLLALLALPPLAAADGLEIEPGKWEFVSTSSFSMMPQPRVEKSTECIEDGKIDPTSLMDASQECSVRDRKLDGATFRWKMECKNPMGLMSGDGELTAKGSEVTGRMQMRMVMNGQPLTFNTTWQGKRLSGCD